MSLKVFVVATRTSRLALLLVASVLLSCLGPPFVGSSRPWSGSAAFVGNLRCNMTQKEIVSIAQQFPKLRIHQPDSSPDLFVARRGDTLVFLGLRASLLETYQISWTSGFTKQSSQLKHDLCSGTRYVELHLIASSNIAGASIWLDGKRVGEVSKAGGFSRDIPLGLHELRVEQSGVGSWTTELHYHGSSSGYDRLPIELMMKQN